MVALPATDNLIAGEWRASHSGSTYTKRDPADTRRELGTFARSDAADVDAAVRAARSAQPSWQAVPAPRRGEILFRFAGLLAAAKEELARTVTLEMGKVVEESRGDVQEAAVAIRALGRLGPRDEVKPFITRISRHFPGPGTPNGDVIEAAVLDAQTSMGMVRVSD